MLDKKGTRSQGKRLKAEDGTTEVNGQDELTNNESRKHIDGDAGPHPAKRPRRAAACDNFREKAMRVSEKSSYIVIKENRIEEEERDAVELTKVGPEDLPPCRKLIDFMLHDADGVLQPFQRAESDDIFITAVIMPLDDSLEKDKERGVKCIGFGRIEDWSISGYDEGSPIVWLSTEIADYECVKPAANYRNYFDHFAEKARVCVEVYRKLARSVGGNPDLGLEELLAAVVRSIGGAITKSFVISIGEFVFQQLIGLDGTASNEDAQLATLPALLALRDECKNRAEFCKLSPTQSNGSLKIKDQECKEVTTEDEDTKLAMLLQEEEEWKVMRQQMGHSGASSKKNVYIKITEAEIANDYPLPAFYKPTVDEMDEYIFDNDCLFYDELPTRVLNHWALYNSDSRFMSLELIPLKKDMENDVTIFGSGYMKEDDGSGFLSESELAQSSSKSGNQEIEGVPIYLSAIKEWQIEFGSSMIFLSIRTDVAWYRLGQPTKQYAPWYEPVLKTARLAISIITLLKEQSRASKLSFADVVKKVSEFCKDDPSYISSNVLLVERYILVHAQIIHRLFSDYPCDTIRKCAFLSTLKVKMEERRHTKLFMKKRVEVLKGENLNPRASMGTVARKNVMRATTTRMITRIWGDYYLHNFPDDSREGDANETKELEEEQENEDDDVDEETIADANSAKHLPALRTSRPTSRGCDETEWEGEPSGKTASTEVTYRGALLRGLRISSGTSVTVRADESEDTLICYIEYMFEKRDGTKMIHGRIMQKGSETVLGNAANEREVFLTNECYEFELGDVAEAITVKIQSLPWGHKYRKDNAEAERIERAKAEERSKKGLPLEYICKFLYCPEKGAFLALPSADMGLGSGACTACEQREADEDVFKINSKSSFTYKKVVYCIDDYLYISPGFFPEEVEEGHVSYKAGRNVGLKPYVICRLLEIEIQDSYKDATPVSTKVKVRRFYRPEDISSAKAYSSDVREVYYSEDIVSVPVEEIEGKCEFIRKSDLPLTDQPVLFGHQFFCERMYDSATGNLKQLPTNVKFTLLPEKASNGSMKKAGKKKCDEEEGNSIHCKDASQENCLATLDIFAGCGGLSEGLQQSGAAKTKWAIEYEEPAGEAFSENHPDSSMFVHNCNVILKAIMDKCGDSEDCIATSDAAEQAAELSEEKIKNLPVPGEVDFINGGPPCQGFSGMNRFSRSPWSKVQCEMILAFLSFADYFRPRYFLLENVRTFVSFNKGQTFRLTIASLLEMGYQVRFGILEAGAYGVAQSRKRAFIWAASPEDKLPEWPEPMHVFAGPELKINMPNGTSYAAVKSTAGGAPYRSMTVRDTIGELPPVANGASNPSINYGSDPVSWFQRKIRGGMVKLNDHISKEMNELNLIRCKRIPKRPGSDWRDLPDEKVTLSTGQVVDLIPWCLPNTAKRHNQWKGLFGRLDWEGNFPTSITDPQPMGKVGMCFHPEQDRIITVRECARSQGFPDSYQFSGNIISKHKQIGNAVPPPLAFALGVKLKEAISANA